MGLFDAFKKKAVKGVVPEKKVVKRIKYPNYIGDAACRYLYVMPITPINGCNLNLILGDEEKVLDIMPEGDRIIYSYNGRQIGYSEDSRRARMLSDWIKKDDPTFAALLYTGDSVNLRFYKDLRKYIGNRESTITPLTAYRGKDAQEVLSLLEAGDEVWIDEEDGKVNIVADDTILGRLPAKITRRYFDEGAYAAYIENMEEELTDDYESIYIPTIRIYW